MNTEAKYIVVGGGLAGLMAAIRIAEAGGKVDVFSLVPVKRSHSVCAQGGINAVLDVKGQADTIWEHFDDTVYGGDFLAHQPPVKSMVEEAPHIINMYDRMGVMFSRTPEGILDQRYFGGVKKRRTAFAGATTGQQLMYALDEQTRPHEVSGAVTKYEGWQFLGLVRDGNGRARGIAALDLKTGEVRTFRGDAVLLATGGFGMVYGRSTTSTICNGGAASAIYQQGALLANMEFIQIHPTAMPGEDKNRLMSESARGEGGRIWVPRKPGDTRDPRQIPEAERFYFLEERYPAYGNLVPRDIAAREISKVCVEEGLGIGGENVVYLDLTHMDADYLTRRLGGILEIYQKFAGADPRQVPMKIFPSVHYSMGGIWVDYNQMTSIPGCFAAGECDYQYHGANRLGANSLLSATYSGSVAGRTMREWVAGQSDRAADAAASFFESEQRRHEQINATLLAETGEETPTDLHRELGEWMTRHASVVRLNKGLDELIGHLDEMLERFRTRLGLTDKGRWLNQQLAYARDVGNMLQTARAVARAARNRDESRGSHYKPEFPERNDEKYLFTTKIAYDAAKDEPVLDYSEAIDVQHIAPRKRDYSVNKKA
ncbi:MAG: succinate dehydrogenase flavoprotein subunit [Candidatus Krumholzibacteriota bacterium]|nr:succinate dehydrogenase flavoprotein subunit [Candidatus Krumholzibacteriota bacterium]